jgi:hypothetical protein
MKACACDCEFQDVTNDIRILIGNAITQIPVNPNIATTGHKLQGMSKNKNTLIVNNWDKVCELGVCCPVRRLDMNMNRDFSIPQQLIDFEAE